MSSAGLQDGLVGLGQDLVADLGVGHGPVLLPQVEAQLALVAEVQVALLTLRRQRAERMRRTAGGQDAAKDVSILS